MDRHKGQHTIGYCADEDELGAGQRPVAIRTRQQIPPDPEQEPRHSRRNLRDAKNCKQKRNRDAYNQRPDDLAREMEPLQGRLVHTTSLAETWRGDDRALIQVPRVSHSPGNAVYTRRDGLVQELDFAITSQ